MRTYTIVLGSASASLNKPVHSIQCFEEACLLDPDAVAFRLNLGRALETVQGWPRAVDCYRTALMLQHDSVEALGGLARSCFMTGEAEEGLQSIQALELLRPLAVSEKLLLADTLLLLDKAENALTLADEILKEWPDFSRARVTKARALQLIGRHLEASSELITVIKANPSFIPAYVQLGRVLEIHH